MATGLGVVSFAGVGLDNSDGVYRKSSGSGESLSVQSRLIELPGGGSFDPDTGVDRTPTTRQITESYHLQGTEVAVRTKANAILGKVGCTGVATLGDGSTVTARLINYSRTIVKTHSVGSVVYNINLTWEIPT